MRTLFISNAAETCYY